MAKDKDNATPVGGGQPAAPGQARKLAADASGLPLELLENGKPPEFNGALKAVQHGKFGAVEFAVADTFAGRRDIRVRVSKLAGESDEQAASRGLARWLTIFTAGHKGRGGGRV